MGKFSGGEWQRVEKQPIFDINFSSGFKTVEEDFKIFFNSVLELEMESS